MRWLTVGRWLVDRQTMVNHATVRWIYTRWLLMDRKSCHVMMHGEIESDGAIGWWTATWTCDMHGRLQFVAVRQATMLPGVAVAIATASRTRMHNNHSLDAMNATHLKHTELAHLHRIANLYIDGGQLAYVSLLPNVHIIVDIKHLRQFLQLTISEVVQPWLHLETVGMQATLLTWNKSCTLNCEKGESDHDGWEQDEQIDAKQYGAIQITQTTLDSPNASLWTWLFVHFPDVKALQCMEHVCWDIREIEFVNNRDKIYNHVRRGLYIDKTWFIRRDLQMRKSELKINLRLKLDTSRIGLTNNEYTTCHHLRLHLYMTRTRHQTA